MTVTIQQIGPQDIETESFRIIEKELGPHSFDARTYKVVQRVIHATGDFSFAESLRFSENGLQHGIEALQEGKHILTDVSMVASGISKPLLQQWNTRVDCHIGEQRIAEAAKAGGVTRSDMAMEEGLRDDIGIVAIGNAPTALLKVMKLLESAPFKKLPLVIGIPVGFVNAAESKELLRQTDLPFITNVGRKGGSPVAAAIVNALIRLARG